MKYRILEQVGAYDTHYIVQYKKWGLWCHLSYNTHPLPITVLRKFKTVEEAEKAVLEFFNFKHNKTKTVLKKEGEVK